MPTTAPTPSQIETLDTLKAENARLREELAKRQALPEDMAATITKLLETERALRARERDLRAILDNMPSMIGYWDRDLRNRFGNHAYRIWFGIDPADMPGMHIRDVIGEERYRLNLPYIEAALRGEPQTFERAIPTPDGRAVRHSLAQYIPDVVDGEVQGFFVLVSDITAVKEAEARAAASTSRFDELVRRISVGVYTFRVEPDGRMGFDYVSPRLCELIDIPAEDLLRDHTLVFAATHPEDRQDLIDTNARAVTSGEPFHWEGRVLIRGETRWFHLDSTATPLPGGGASWNGVVTDITPQKMLELELRVSNSDLKQFAYVASHDLKSPLRNIVSYLQLLERRYGDRFDADAREFIGYAVGGAKQMTALIDDLLDYSRIDSRAREFAPVALDDLAAEIVDRHRAAIAAAGATVTVQDRLPVVMGDAIQLGQLLFNLLDNALKYRIPDRAPTIRLTAERTGADWTIALADNGIGIDAEFAERVFAIFQRLHSAEAYPGTGIGLALCKRVVERHGGRIWVESAPAGGCVFKFTLPANPPRPV